MNHVISHCTEATQELYKLATIPWLLIPYSAALKSEHHLWNPSCRVNSHHYLLRPAFSFGEEVEMADPPKRFTNICTLMIMLIQSRQVIYGSPVTISLQSHHIPMQYAKGMDYELTGLQMTELANGLDPNVFTINFPGSSPALHHLHDHPEKERHKPDTIVKKIHGAALHHVSVTEPGNITTEWNDKGRLVGSQGHLQSPVVRHSRAAVLLGSTQMESANGSPSLQTQVTTENTTLPPSHSTSESYSSFSEFGIRNSSVSPNTKRQRFESLLSTLWIPSFTGQKKDSFTLVPSIELPKLNLSNLFVPQASLPTLPPLVGITDIPLLLSQGLLNEVINPLDQNSTTLSSMALLFPTKNISNTISSLIHSELFSQDNASIATENLLSSGDLPRLPAGLTPSSFSFTDLNLSSIASMVTQTQSENNHINPFLEILQLEDYTNKSNSIHNILNILNQSKPPTEEVEAVSDTNPIGYEIFPSLTNNTVILNGVRGQQPSEMIFEPELSTEYGSTQQSSVSHPNLSGLTPTTYFNNSRNNGLLLGKIPSSALRDPSSLVSFLKGLNIDTLNEHEPGNIPERIFRNNEMNVQRHQPDNEKLSTARVTRDDGLQSATIETLYTVPMLSYDDQQLSYPSTAWVPQPSPDQGFPVFTEFLGSKEIFIGENNDASTSSDELPDQGHSGLKENFFDLVLPNMLNSSNHMTFVTGNEQTDSQVDSSNFISDLLLKLNTQTSTSTERTPTKSFFSNLFRKPSATSPLLQFLSSPEVSEMPPNLIHSLFSQIIPGLSTDVTQLQSQSVSVDPMVTATEQSQGFFPDIASLFQTSTSPPFIPPTPSSAGNLTDFLKKTANGLANFFQFLTQFGGEAAASLNDAGEMVQAISNVATTGINAFTQVSEAFTPVESIFWRKIDKLRKWSDDLSDRSSTVTTTTGPFISDQIKVM
ncbi:uncharacterized protein LOC143020356 isoform X2 [Oratosquilla oratoria]|uniref:uncharacterized protein LOC143020356 isoform X2 n=1 Tax=Oratosquilla oratoria TaxID=337810 RepID=UPI003F75FE5D